MLFRDAALAANDDGTTGPVAAVLGAGFNRSTLVSSAAQPTSDTASFSPVHGHPRGPGVRRPAGRSSVVV
ncbi:hypothetical protein GCM10011428_53830 [Streptomyces violaceus]